MKTKLFKGSILAIALATTAMTGAYVVNSSLYHTTEVQSVNNLSVRDNGLTYIDDTNGTFTYSDSVVGIHDATANYTISLEEGYSFAVPVGDAGGSYVQTSLYKGSSNDGEPVGESPYNSGFIATEADTDTYSGSVEWGTGSDTNVLEPNTQYYLEQKVNYRYDGTGAGDATPGGTWLVATAGQTFTTAPLEAIQEPTINASAASDSQTSATVTYSIAANNDDTHEESTINSATLTGTGIPVGIPLDVTGDISDKTQSVTGLTAGTKYSDWKISVDYGAGTDTLAEFSIPEFETQGLAEPDEPTLTATATATGQTTADITLDGALSADATDTYKGYEVTGATVTDGTDTLTSTYSEGVISVTGLTAGTDYTFTITPIWKIADGEEKDFTNTYTATVKTESLTAAQAPTIESITTSGVTDTTADISAEVTIPTNDGTYEETIISSVTVSVDGGTTTTPLIAEDGGTTYTGTITGLTEGTTYTPEVTVNYNGDAPVVGTGDVFTTIIPGTVVDPTIKSVKANNISTTSADVKYTLNKGTATITSVALDVDGLGTDPDAITDGAESGTFSLTGLVENTEYTGTLTVTYDDTVDEEIKGQTITDDSLSFTTLEEVAPVATVSSSVEGTTATVDYNIDKGTAQAITSVALDAPDFTVDPIEGDSTSGSFTVEGLAAGSIYNDWTLTVSYTDSTGTEQTTEPITVPEIRTEIAAPTITIDEAEANTVDGTFTTEYHVALGDGTIFADMESGAAIEISYGSNGTSLGTATLDAATLGEETTHDGHINLDGLNDDIALGDTVDITMNVGYSNGTPDADVFTETQTYSFVYGQEPEVVTNDTIMESFDSISLQGTANDDGTTINYEYKAKLNKDLSDIVKTLTINVAGATKEASGTIEVAGADLIAGDEIILGSVDIDSTVTELTTTLSVELNSGYALEEDSDGTLDLGDDSSISNFTQDDAIAEGGIIDNFGEGNTGWSTADTVWTVIAVIVVLAVAGLLIKMSKDKKAADQGNKEAMDRLDSLNKE